VGSRSPDGWDQNPYRSGGWVLHQSPFGFDSQTRGNQTRTRETGPVLKYRVPQGSQENAERKCPYTGFPMSAHLSRLRLFQRHLRSLVWVWIWVWDWIHSHAPPRTRSPSSRHPPFTHYPFPLCSLVCVVNLVHTSLGS
jgi:hypothetical protein